MVLPLGHTQPGSVRRQLSARERWMIGAVLGALVALMSALAASQGFARVRPAAWRFRPLLAERAVARVSERFAWPAVARATVEVYRTGANAC